MKMNMKRKIIWKALVAFTIALAFVLPGSAVFDNVETIEVTSNGEKGRDIENLVTNPSNNNAIIISTIPIENRDIIYVDDDAVPPYAGTPEHPYKFIQQGIENATAGDTIYVLNGTYAENVLVNKTLNLLGESRENVLVTGGGGWDEAIEVTVNNVNISSFTVINQSYGIYLNSDSNTINNCTVYNTGVHGITIQGDYNVVTNCDASNTNFPIYIYQGSYNNILSCSAYNALMGSCFRVEYSYYNNITDCYVYDSTQWAFYFRYAQNNYVINCNIVNNSYNGLCFDSSPNNNVIDCVISGNGFGGPYPVNKYGIYIASSTNIMLSGNTINDNCYNMGIIGDYYHNIDHTNTIDGQPVYYLVSQENLTLDESNNFGYLALVACFNITAKNSDVSDVLVVDSSEITLSNITAHHSSGKAFYILNSPGSSIINCEAYDNEYGFHLQTSPTCNVTSCTAYENTIKGFQIQASGSSNITNCVAYNNDGGMTLANSEYSWLRDNAFYDNNFNFGVSNGFYQDIDPTNTVDGKPIYYLIGQANLTLDESNNMGYLALLDCFNITAKNADVSCVMLRNTGYSMISNVTSHNCSNGIWLGQASSYNQIINCTVYANSDGIYLQGNSNNNEIINCNAYDNSQYGIHFRKCSNNVITNCDVYDNINAGIYLDTSPCNYNIFSYCNIYNNGNDGINIYGPNLNYNNILFCNIFNNNDRGISIGREWGNSINNVIHHNNLVNNIVNAGVNGNNIWDNGYPSGGNYWSDYTGVDNYSGPAQNISGSDGIGDTPYVIAGINQDNYPLMLPLAEIDISPIITDVYANPDLQSATAPVNITCTVIDNIEVDIVKVHVDGPGGFTLEVEMNEGSYWYEHTYTTLGDYNYYIWANDTSGNIAVSDTYSFVITDFEIPISQVNALPPWHTGVPFIITATASDNTGVSTVTLWSRYSGDGINWNNWSSYGTDENWPWSWEFTGIDGFYEFYSIAVDDYNNEENPPAVADTSTGIDTIDPITVHALSPETPDGENEWYVSNVTVTLSATDNTSGIESTWYKIDDGWWHYYTSPFTVGTDGYHVVQYYSFDNAWNIEATKSVSFNIDNTVPSTNHEFDGLIGIGGWYVTNVTVTLIANDALSGVNYTMYKINNDTWITYTEPFIVAENGDHTLYYYSVDLAGNTELENETSFKIEHDVIPPVTTHSFEGVMGDNDWYTSNVVVELFAEDDSSGVDYTMYKLDDDPEWQIYTGLILVTEDGEHTISYYSVDKVGNEEPPSTPVDFKVDKTAPTIELTWDRENSKLIATVNDESSGIAKVEFYVNGVYSGEVTTPPFEWVITRPRQGDKGQAIAFDNAGNTAISEEINAYSQSQVQGQPSATPSSSTTVISQLLYLK